MKKLLCLSLVAFVCLFSGCSDDNGVGNVTKEAIKTKNDQGEVPSSVIPDEIRKQFEAVMPIYSGVTPPDISGQYRATPYVLAGSSDGGYSVGDGFADRYVAFIKGDDGKLSFRGKQGNAQSASDAVYVQVVGEGNEFTAYFEAIGENSDGIRTRQSTLVSGKLTSNGIQNFYFAWVMLEKWNDPSDKLVPVNTYRIFKDSDGLASRYTWLD